MGRDTQVNGAEVRILGGYIDNGFTAYAGSHVTISGGIIRRDFNAYTGSSLTVVGGDFRLNGAPIAGLDTVGAEVQTDIPWGGVLSGELPDGRLIKFSSESSDTISNGTMTLRRAAIAPTGPPVINAPFDPVPATVRAGQTLILGNGASVRLIMV